VTLLVRDEVVVDIESRRQHAVLHSVHRASSFADWRCWFL